jgi:hypothetical protein
MPWTALQRGGEPGDGWFLALEYLGNWSLSVEHADPGPLTLTADVPDLAAVSLPSGQQIELPAITLGAFAGTLDDMTVRCYDWQYRYLWDYTNMDYYARPKWAVPWTYCAQNLQEQFGERLAYLDMNADLARAVGFEMLWDDAGWSSYAGLPPDNYGSVFTPTYEGPDFRETQRYLEKMGMRWLAWFAGRPSPGVLAGKIGAWGDFEWRSDAVAFPDWAADRDWRDRILRFLDNYPGASFHTCSGGSTYSHTFDIQRYANTNYFADAGCESQTNYYFSYLEPPDKWVDILEPWTHRGAYEPATARRTMTMVPFWGLCASPEDQERLRQDLDTYRYLRREGVAGRWSYMFHPAVTGDDPTYYAQRTSYDRTRACIILKHQPSGPVTVFPRSLLPDHPYLVEFDRSPETTTRTGADLMAHGVTLADPLPGELIYLGLPHRPRSGRPSLPPTPPGAALSRRETNLGHSGVAVYWSASGEESWISYYEVRRGEEILGPVSTGTMFFDHAEDWDPAARYSVRSGNGEGQVSAWTAASRLPDQPRTACSLGGLFAEPGREGWIAETTTDGITFTPMTWVPPAGTSSADEGGTPNQRGGIEGCWEGPGGARLARAWMQASREACCVRTWIAPQAGTVRVTSRVMKEWYSQAYGAPLRARILHGTRQVWPERGWAVVPLNDVVGLTHDLTLEVAAGDPLRFVLDRGTENQHANLQFAASWTVFGPCDRFKRAPETELARLPESLTAGDQPLPRQEVPAPEGVVDFASLWGGSEAGQSAYVFIPVHVRETGRYLLGFGAQGWYSAWLDGTPISGTATIADYWAAQGVTDPVVLATGRDDVADRENHTVNVELEAGEHVLALRFTSGGAGAQLDVGLPPSGANDLAAWMPRITYVEAPTPAPTGPGCRILCGATEPYTDRNGQVWSADCHYRGGRAVATTSVIQGAWPTEEDQSLYQHGRQGREFSYTIPVPSGLYAVRLKFAEPRYAELFRRPFHVSLNGREVLRNFDICQDARGFRRAHDRVFRYVVPNAEGKIVLDFMAGFEPGQKTAPPLVQAIEVLPEPTSVVRINCGSAADFVDWNSFVWSADHDFAGGEALLLSLAVAQAVPTLYDQALYHTARSGPELSYAVALPPGLYTVHLKFAELWLREVGQRAMDLEINGRRVWQSWDPAAAAGQVGMAIDLRALHIAPDVSGHIVVNIRAVGGNDAILQGLEIE